MNETYHDATNGDVYGDYDDSTKRKKYDVNDPKFSTQYSHICIHVDPKSYDKCGKQANFGFNPGCYLYCSEHKLTQMTNVRCKNCSVCNLIRPSFGYEGKVATHCGTCKTEGMMDVRSYKKCSVCNLIRPIFGYEGKVATHCFKCKSADMIDLKNKKCSVCNDARPSFGNEGSGATHCFKCKSADMIDVLRTFCDDCHISYANSNYENKCYTCFVTQYPDSELALSSGNKTEGIVKEFLNSVNAKIATDYTFNRGNARGSHAPLWFYPYEMDFILLGNTNSLLLTLTHLHIHYYITLPHLLTH